MKKYIKFMFTIAMLILFTTHSNVFANNRGNRDFVIGAEYLYNYVSSSKEFALTVSKMEKRDNPNFNSVTYRFTTNGPRDNATCKVTILVGASGYIGKLWISGTNAGGADTYMRTLCACLKANYLSDDELTWLFSHAKITTIDKYRCTDAEVECNKTGRLITIYIRENLNDGSILGNIGPY